VPWACLLILDLKPALTRQDDERPHTIEPTHAEVDEFQSAALENRGEEQEMASGGNRMSSIPCAGASTERQYMVYFRSATSCMQRTLSLNDDARSMTRN